jgi:uncharacterized SAM-binding protein YcdF (DUF218 family)
VALCAVLAAILLIWMPGPLAGLVLQGLAAIGSGQGSATEHPQAIVVIGGRDSRARTAAELAKETGLPVYLAGKELVPELKRSGVEPTWTESISIDTQSNARVAACLLGRGGVRDIFLVTDSYHMPRASLWFRRYGFRVTQAPHPVTAEQMPPNSRSASARHELEGLVAFALTAANKRTIDCDGAQKWLEGAKRSSR